MQSLNTLNRNILSSVHGNQSFEAFSVKRGLNTFAKNIDPCPPAQLVQADMDRNIFAIFKLSACQSAIPHYDQLWVV